MACKMRCLGQLSRETYNVFVQTFLLLAAHFALCFAHELALECLFLVGTRPLFLGQDLGGMLGCPRTSRDGCASKSGNALEILVGTASTDWRSEMAESARRIIPARASVTPAGQSRRAFGGNSVRLIVSTAHNPPPTDYKHPV
jgi:hypothetical protein